MIEPSFSALIPAILAISVALVTRQVYIALFVGVWAGYFLMPDYGIFSALGQSVDGIVGVLQDPYDAKVIAFTLAIGALIATMESSGGVRGFVDWLEHQRWVSNRRRSRLLAWCTGIVIFIESNMTVLVAGAVSRPLFDSFKISREKLAYLIDSTSAPICVLIPLNAWGAFNLGLLQQQGVDNPFGVFLAAIPLNLYALSAVALAGFVAWKDWNIGPMKKAEARTASGKPLSEAAMVPTELAVVDQTATSIAPRARNMLVPVLVMIASMPMGLWITGQGDMTSGDGAKSILWAVLIALLASWLLLLGQRAFNLNQLTQIAMRGAGGLLPIAIILVFALALGDITKALKAGEYVASVLQGAMPPWALLPLVFLVAGAMAFSTGSSWGTFAVTLPIALPVGQLFGLPDAMVFAAVLSGGIFGDHASPISDTTIISSMAASTDHIDHVRTQLPYCLIAGGFSLLGFTVLGFTV